MKFYERTNIDEKAKVSESGITFRSKLLDDFILTEMNSLSTYSPKSVSKLPSKAFDKIFKQILETI